MASKGCKRKAVAVGGKGDENNNNWAGQTVAQLRKECSSRGLAQDGVKAVLIKRLVENDKEEEVEDVSPVNVKKTRGKTVAIEEEVVATSSGDGKVRKPDGGFPNPDSVQVFADYDCMLNQTNIKDNNNKFYVLQILQDKGKDQYQTWCRWGRVGEPGRSMSMKSSDVAACVKDFERKFKDKTKNEWKDRGTFVAYDKKYTLIEVSAEDGDPEELLAERRDAKKAEEDADFLECTLEKKTRELVELIFSSDMFNSAMEHMNLDIRKMPLGKLSRAQIDKGFDALLAIEDAVKKKSPAAKLEGLSSKFYTLIPHNFGRSRPSVIDNLGMLTLKKDMLNVLLDIELAQSMQKDGVEKKSKSKALDPHPVDEKYKILRCELEPLLRRTEEFKAIATYFENTGKDSCLKLQEVWKVRRECEAERFEEHEAIEHRKLLWHGTSVAVVAAILKEGLRIMPHSGGRVGKGLYFASECSKSAGYIQVAHTGQGVMFLTEVALGKERYIMTDDCSLTKPPKGYDSVVARGTREPDPSKDKKLKLGHGKDVVVPLGKPVEMAQYKKSNFSQSEYLVYRESQASIRYLLTVSNSG